MKLKIVSDGTPGGTFVYGEDANGDWHTIERVAHVSWEFEAGMPTPRATIHLAGPQIAASFDGSTTERTPGDNTPLNDDDIPF